MENKKQKGSALVFALIMLSIMIVIAVGSFSASVIDQKTSNDTERSVSAFQAADTGVEEVLKIINSEIELGGSLQTLASAGLCNSGSQYVDSTSLAGRMIKVSFYKTGDVLVTDCFSAIISEIDYIKSTGEFGGTVRAVSVSVEAECPDSVSDSEGNAYGTIIIGDQCWMDQNMNIGTKLADAATLPFDDSEIEKWCYNNNDAICDTDGGLYTWAEANDLDAVCNTTSCTPPSPNQGICPVGWHIPTDQEYIALEEELGMCSGTGAGCSGAAGWRGTDQGSKLSMLTLNGDNSSGFTGLLVGRRNTGGNFSVRNSITHFWTASKYSATNSWRRSLSSSVATVDRSNSDKAYGFSVRCLKD